MAAITTFVPNMTQHSTGAKIKRSTAKQYNFPRQAGGYCGANGRDATSTSVLNPIDSLVLMSKTSERERSCSMRKDNREMEASEDLHPMQSIYLGSDRRYNRYWLFLGPCNGSDPGHKRIYFESSEDGNWEFIDNEEVLGVFGLERFEIKKFTSQISITFYLPNHFFISHISHHKKC